MKRDLDRLCDGPFDLLVIGGGIYGAWAAYDAALRGLSVALIEQSDWASGTSSASSKLIHGGLRYLEQLHFGLVKRSLEERRRLARLGPHRVRPLRFLIPVYRHSRVGRLRLRAGLWLYDTFAGPNQPVARHDSMKRDELLSRHGYLNGDGLLGGLSYGDCQTDDAQFVLEIVHGAAAAGAVVANYVRAADLHTSRGEITGATAIDQLTGDRIEINAATVVNATGMWPPVFDDDSVVAPRVRLSKGAHIVLPPLPTQDALLITARSDKRVFFVIPWYGKTLLGTTDSDYDGDPDRVSVLQEDIDYLLGEANLVIDEPKWDETMIHGMFAGVRALKFESGRDPASVTREWVVESPVRGLFVSIGGKYTSARADAADMVQRALEHLGKPSGPSPTESEPFPWSPPADADLSTAPTRGVELGMDPETSLYCTHRMGNTVESVYSLILERADLAERLDPRLPFCKAEIIIGARDRMAITLEDLLRRRLPILILSRIDRMVLEEAVRLASPILGWDSSRGRQEIQQVMEKWGVKEDRA